MHRGAEAQVIGEIVGVLMGKEPRFLKRYPVAAGFLVEHGREKRCPFCGARFSRYWGFAKHLFTTHSRELEQMARAILRKEPEERILGLMSAYAARASVS